eukprot:EG_transcript_17714
MQGANGWLWRVVGSLRLQRDPSAWDPQGDALFQPQRGLVARAGGEVSHQQLLSFRDRRGGRQVVECLVPVRKRRHVLHLVEPLVLQQIFLVEEEEHAVTRGFHLCK